LKKNKFKFIGVFISLLILILVAAISQFNKDHVDVKKEKASMIIEIDEMLTNFKNDEDNANKKYTDKIIQLKGVISEISTQDGNATVTLDSPNFDANIICSFQSEDNLKILKFKAGDEIFLKGICTGYLLDVVVVKCVLL